ncbi:hypothetical protein EVAR_77581_1 [Eumeta japonica]|uniref:Uncharacterized protein n=1 Tax=Eumeta variegata TaxID=151549 RepID=A0A4C1T6N3_EUMVA|nr:hypothetical protein EVAR_77581_1 [Eumeta japonica]
MSNTPRTHEIPRSVRKALRCLPSIAPATRMPGCSQTLPWRTSAANERAGCDNATRTQRSARPRQEKIAAPRDL